MDPAYQQPSGAEIIMQNYEIFVDSEQNIQFMCFTREAAFLRIYPSFCPEISGCVRDVGLIVLDEIKAIMKLKSLDNSNYKTSNKILKYKI